MEENSKCQGEKNASSRSLSRKTLGRVSGGGEQGDGTGEGEGKGQ